MSTLQEDVSSTIAFVKLIERNPCLWNYSLEDYSRLDITGAAWKSIAGQLDDTEYNCRCRWKNIRSAFGRSIKLAIEGKSKKPYYLSNYLSFLLPFIKNSGNKRSATPRKVDDEEESTTDSVQESRRKRDSSDESENEFESLEERSIKLESGPDSSNRPEKRPSSDNEAPLLDWFDMKEYKKMKRNEYDQDDSDWLFFRSVLLDFRKLENRRKRALKVKFMALLNEQLDEAETEVAN
ncbi:unnamed protein product [Phyllotreta striolata]|uniref:MADF domain-containing protein n=1 Tax=Phyllotreta striolata TaxID=444603 RepID=A0A9N9TSH4_PHYSR|nr:unnamed protein product [Phyllotreta striolata]